MSTMLYITYIDFGESKSASSVRPQMMYDAFVQLGVEVQLLQTQQNKKQERFEAVAKIDAWLDRNRPDFCYVESPSGLIFQSCDHKLLKRLHKMGVPTGYFYRDAAFKFPDVFRSERRGFLREKAISYLSNRDFEFLKKNVDLVYLPTQSAAEYFDFPHTAVLPPACAGHLGDKRGKEHQRRSIYVGGISKRYGTDTLLQAFDLLNPSGAVQYPLTLICRESEQDYIRKYRDRPWLEIAHVSGKENLKPFYEKADLGLMPLEKNAYNDWAFAVKMTEYMEFGLPIVSVNLTESERFIQKYGIGLVSHDTPESFAKKIREMFEDPQAYAGYCNRVYEAVDQGNLWIDRAKTVINDLNR